MTAAILLMCLLENPQTCEERKVPLWDATLSQCMQGAEMIATQAARENTGWTVERLRCEKVNTTGR